jgi:hypothetical protein
MKSKLLRIVLMSALFLLPATVWAQINTKVSNGSFIQNEASEGQLVPLELYSGSYIYADKEELNSPRNQISETAVVAKTLDAYEVTLRIGSYHLLDMLQIVREDKIDEVLDETNDVTNGELWRLPAGTFSYWQGGEERYQAWLDEGEVNEEYNDYYYAQNEIMIKPDADLEMDAATVTIKVKDLSKPILIKTYSDFYGKEKGSNEEYPTSQIVLLKPEQAIDSPVLKEGTYPWNIKWMGFVQNASISSSSHTRVSQAGANTFFVKAFENIASITLDANGDAFATLTMTQPEQEDDQIVKIESAIRRDTSDQESFTGDDVRMLLSEYDAEYEELEIKNGQVEIPVRDLIYGQGLRITTKKLEGINQGKDSKNQEYHYSFLHIWSGGTEERTTYTDAGTGVSVVYYNSDFSGGAPQIQVTTSGDYVSESVLNSYGSFSKDYRVYTFHVMDGKGNMASTANPVDKIIPVPEDWNISTMQIFRYGAGSTSAEFSASTFFNKEKNALIVSDTTIGGNNCTMIVYDGGEAETAEGLMDGVYKVNVGIGHRDDPLRVSLSNAAFAGKEAYIEAKDGLAVLYMNIGGVTIGAQNGYLSNMFSLEGDKYETRREVDYLSYGTDASGAVRVNTDQKRYMAFDVERVAFPLKNPTENNTYWVSFFIPAMDGISGGLPGSGVAEQSAQVRLSHIEKVEDGINPIGVYEKNAVSGAADYLGFLAENAGWSNEKSAYARRISEETKEQIKSGAMHTDDQETVLHGLAVIKAARESISLEKGLYEIPILNQEEWSEYKTPVNVMVKDGSIMIQLEKADETSLPSIEYHGDYDSYQSDTTVSADGKAVSFTIPYTEAALAIKTGGEEQSLSLDFANAKRKSADLSSLRLLLKKATDFVSGEISYTENSKKALVEEIKNTETLLESFDIGQTKVDEQYQALQTAIDHLAEKANLTQLKKDLVSAIKASKNSDYAEDGRKRLALLIEEIQMQIKDENQVSKVDEEAYRKQLQDEMALLEEGDGGNGNGNENDGSLKSFLTDYESWVKEEDYTKESWEAFAAEKEEAQSLLTTGNLTKTEEEEAIQKLLDSRNLLVADIGMDSRLATLSEKVEELDERSSEYAGLISYSQLEASMEAARGAAKGKYYLTSQELNLLEKSLEAFEQVCEAEASGESSPDQFQMEIPELSLEELEELQGNKTVKKPIETVPETIPVKETEIETEIETESETKEIETKETEESKADTETETGSTAETKEEAETKIEESKTREETKTENNVLPTASLSRNNTHVLLSSYSSDSNKDGTYSVDYDLWKWNENKPSMGNPAMDYGTQPGKIIRDNGKWTLYIHFNGMKYGEFEGSLRTMKKMVDIKDTEDGLSYKTQKADYPKTVTEYPEILGFVVTPESGKQYTYMPVEVEVDVPGMALGAQNARLKVDWDSLDYINGSTDIDSSLDLGDLSKAIQKAENLSSKESSYTTFSFKVLIESIKAAKEIKASSLATQKVADLQVKAIEASINALVKVAGDSTLSNLSSMLMESYMADESDYSKNAWRELERARTAAELLQGGNDVTEGMVTQAVLELKTALGRTGGGGGKGEDGLSTSVLERIIKLSEKESEETYTAASWKNLEEALKDAKAILVKAAKNQCTQADIDEQTTLLKDAYSSLKKIQKQETGSVNYKYLKALVTRAKEFIALSSKYTDDSIRRLLLEYDAAVLMLEDDEVVQQDVDEQKENLRTAINSLALTSTSSGSDGNTGNNGNTGNTGNTGGTSNSGRKDGYYKVKVRLWHATMDKASLGESAIMPTAFVKIEDGDVTMRLQTKKMSLQGITANLHDFYIYNGGDYETTELISTEDNKWIFEFNLPDDSSKYYKCQVDPRVEVMGNDPVKARLRVDWSSTTKSNEDDWEKLSGSVDKDSSDTSSTSVKTSVAELISSETGIRIKGNAGGPAVTMEVSKKTSGTEYDKANATLKETANQFVLYDIKLKSGTSYVQPKESVTLRIPVPTGYDTEKLILYRINEEGVKEEISGKMNGSYYEANVDHFSLYALAESELAIKAVKSVSSNATGSLENIMTTGKSKASGGSNRLKSTVTASSKEKGNSVSGQIAAGRVIPYTGDQTPVKELMGVAILAVFICLGTGMTGKKKEGK